MKEQLYRKVPCKDRLPVSSGDYNTNMGELHFFNNVKEWHEYGLIALPEWWLEPVEDIWRSPNEIPPENDTLFSDYSVPVLITDGKYIIIGFYDREYRKWDWNSDMELNNIIGWQYLPALPKSKAV